MGKQDIIQVLTPDHSVEAVFLDEEATVEHLLAALAEDNPDYSQDWTVVEVAMPRKAALTYPELYALDQGALPPSTLIKEVQERHQDLLQNPDATVLKLVHAHWTLPVLFRHVPNVPESHYRQIHITPSMNVRQIVDIVTREMGLQPPEGQAATASYIFMQITVHEDDTEEERQLPDEDLPFELLKENRELRVENLIKDYHFVFTVPDSWLSKVESVTSRITKGWTSSRPLSMAVYGLFTGTSPPAQTTPREISAPIPLAPTSIHHPTFADSDPTENSIKKTKRQSMIAGSRLSSIFDPATLGSWLAPENKRHSIVIGQSMPNLISKPFRAENGAGHDVQNMSDEELHEAFVSLMNDLNIKDTQTMMQMSREKKVNLIVQSRQLQQSKERVSSPEPQVTANVGSRASVRSKYMGSISSRVSFIEPDNSNHPAKLHSRYSSWSSLTGPYDDDEPTPKSPKLHASDRPMSPTANTGTLWSNWFGSTPLPDSASMDEVVDDTPQFYIDQLLSRTTNQKTLAKHLLGLRIALATAKLSWIKQFLDGKGFRALENVLDRTAVKKRGGKANDLDETLQSECVQCLRVLMNTEPGFSQVLKAPSLVAHISYCLYTTNSKLRTKVAEVLAALCVMSPESHRLVLMALSDFRVALDERFRFEYLIETLAAPISSDLDGSSDHQNGFEWEYKTACLSLMNALANSPAALDVRISLRNELRRRGLEDVFKTLQMQGPPESLLIQINVYEDERHEDLIELQERNFEGLPRAPEQGQQSNELMRAITELGPADDSLYPRIIQVLQQHVAAAKSSLTQEEADEDSGSSIWSQNSQFKEDLWTIVEKFGEHVFLMRDIEKDWATCQDEFLESVQHIVGKRGIVLSFSDPNANSSSSVSITGSLSSSRRHSFIDFEIDHLRREIDDMRAEADLMRRDLDAANAEAEDAKTRLAELQQSKELKQSTSPGPALGHGYFSRDLREGSESEPMFSGKRENHAGVVQRLVQKEKEVAQLRETIDRMEKKYKDKADDEPRRSERSKEIDGTRWNAMMSEVQLQKSKTAEVTSLADNRQKEIDYLKRALQIVCTRYESAMGERLPAVTEDDHANQANQTTEGSLQLSKTFEALARKDEEIIELREEVEKLRKETLVGLTPSEEVLNLRGSLKDVMQKVNELQAQVLDRERAIKTLKESLFVLEAAKAPADREDASLGQPSNRSDRPHTRSSLKLQMRALSAKGWQAEEVDEEQEGSTDGMSSGSDSNIHGLAITSPTLRPRGSSFSPPTSPTPGKPRLLGTGRRPALPPPPPPPGPKHQKYEAKAAGQLSAEAPPSQQATMPAVAPSPVASAPPPPPPPPPFVAAQAPSDPMQHLVPSPPAQRPVSPELMQVNSGAPPPPPPPPPPVNTPQTREHLHPQPALLPVAMNNAAPSGPPLPPPPPPPPPPFAPGVEYTLPKQAIITRSVSLPVRSSAETPASPPPPPPPPPMGSMGLKPPSQLPAPPPQPPLTGVMALEGAVPTLPVFLPGGRAANPLKPLAMAIPQPVKPTRPMKQLFWNKLPTGTITQTVWKDICDPSSDLGIVDLDYTEIDEIFCKNQVGVNTTASAIAEKKKNASLLNVNRANNIAIMLSRIKLTYPEIRIALMEILDHKLSIENLKAIKQYVPGSDEIEIIKEYDGEFESLGNAERFYKEIMDIPRLSERLLSMIFRRRLEIEVSELKPELDVLRWTIEELKSSRKLRSLLKTILLMGNHMNAASFRGNAYGFQLDALLKIRDTKGADSAKPGCSTLLHYLAKSIQAKDPSLLRFLDEVPHLEAAARISVPTLMNTVNSFVAGMNQIREEIRVLRRIRISPPSDQFEGVMEKFVEDSEEGIQQIMATGQQLEQDLKDLLIFYGEDPANTKPEDFFGMIVSFSSMLQKSQMENEAMAKRLSKSQQLANNKNRRPSEATTGGLSIAAIRDGHMDDAIRGLRSGLRRNRRDRPMSHLYSELSMETLDAINRKVPRAGELAHSRQNSRV